MSNDEGGYVLTPWGGLAAVLSDYRIDVSDISGKVGEHIVEDFMECMEKMGHVVYVEGDDSDGPEDCD